MSLKVCMCIVLCCQHVNISHASLCTYGYVHEFTGCFCRTETQMSIHRHLYAHGPCCHQGYSATIPNLNNQRTSLSLINACLSTSHNVMCLQRYFLILLDPEDLSVRVKSMLHVGHVKMSTTEKGIDYGRLLIMQCWTQLV